MVPGPTKFAGDGRTPNALMTPGVAKSSIWNVMATARRGRGRGFATRFGGGHECSARQTCPDGHTQTDTDSHLATYFVVHDNAVLCQNL